MNVCAQAIKALVKPREGKLSPEEHQPQLSGLPCITHPNLGHVLVPTLSRLSDPAGQRPKPQKTKACAEALAEVPAPAHTSKAVQAAMKPPEQRPLPASMRTEGLQ
jgi:hypothetical protein